MTLIPSQPNRASKSKSEQKHSFPLSKSIISLSLSLYYSIPFFLAPLRIQYTQIQTNYSIPPNWRMASHHPSELDSYATDSVASSPRSDHQPHDVHTRIRFMCSFGGKIVPRPHDNQLRYVGGDTRIVSVHRATNFSGLLTRLSKLSGISPNSI